MSDKNIQTRPLFDIVRESIINDIIDHAFLPGDKLQLTELASRYGVSETPIKQAFSRLVGEGILTSIPRRGVRVREISYSEMKELIEARHMVNTYSVQSVIAELKDPESDLTEKIENNLRLHGEVVQKLTDDVDFNNFKEYFKIEREYHFLYLHCLGNSTIEKIYEQLYNQAYIYMTFSELFAARIKDAFNEHQEIFKAYRSLSAENVLELLEQHKVNSLKVHKKIFK